tara:strand:+ start:517 stop:720 length:204 start_codon:yes stop_codon:yes gene_type:complete
MTLLFEESITYNHVGRTETITTTDFLTFVEGSRVIWNWNLIDTPAVPTYLIRELKIEIETGTTKVQL